jgi:hypothetical protein
MIEIQRISSKCEISVDQDVILASLDDVIFYNCVHTPIIAGIIQVQEGIFEWTPIPNEWGDTDWEWIKIS